MDVETEFLAQANAKLLSLEEALNEASEDLSTTRTGNVLTIELDDGQQIVVNIQTPMHEIWCASHLGGTHFREVNGQWCDTRTQKTLEATLIDTLKSMGVQLPQGAFA